MGSIYETGVYLENNPDWHEEDSPWKSRQIERIIRDTGIAHEDIIEIGCGTGEILLNLEKAFPSSRLRGYEISPHAFERAERKATDRTSFHFGDFADPDPSDGKAADIALIIDVIEHVDDYIGFVRRLKSAARYKIFHIPLDLSVQSMFRKTPILSLRSSVGHLHYFFKDSALATLRDCGYRIVEHRYTASRLELPNQARSSQLMRWPRKLLFRANPDLTVRLLGGYSLLVLAE